MKAKRPPKLFALSFFLINITSTSLHAQDLHEQSSVRIDPIQQSLHFEAEDFGVLRTYSSQSNFTGIFGVGWCSELDVQVDVYMDQSFRLRGCDPQDGRSLDPRAADSRLRKTQSGFERTRADEAREVFSAQGELLSIENRLQGRIEVRRSRLNERSQWAIRIGNQPELRIDFNREGRVQTWGSTQFSYKADELSGWHRAGRERVELEYDRWSNLKRWSKWTRRQRESGQIDYDHSLDEVRSFVREVGPHRQELSIRRSKSKRDARVLEWKPGAEKSAARVLYDTVHGPLEVHGNSQALESLLDQIRDPQSMQRNPSSQFNKSRKER